MTLVLNEIAFNPEGAPFLDNNSDGFPDRFDDQFIELVNTGSDPLDLSGGLIDVSSDTEGFVHFFPAGTVLAPGQAIVVFGGGISPGGSGGAIFQAASSGRLFESDGSTTITVLSGGPSFNIEVSEFFDIDFGIAVTEIFATYGRQPDLTGDFGFDRVPSPGLDRSLQPFCFGAGTRIAKPEGDCAVEALHIGDMVRTSEGAAVPVKWIGRHTVTKAMAGPHMEPVVIEAGALGSGLPHSDLTVTADHGMVLDGLVINASALVNGTTIRFKPLGDLPARVTYYHVETQAHEVILANGAPAETFVDVATRARFDNYAEYLNLYDVERVIPEMAYPRVSSARMLPAAIKHRLGVGMYKSGEQDGLSARG